MALVRPSAVCARIYGLCNSASLLSADVCPWACSCMVLMHGDHRGPGLDPHEPPPDPLGTRGSASGPLGQREGPRTLDPSWTPPGPVGTPGPLVVTTCTPPEPLDPGPPWTPARPGLFLGPLGPSRAWDPSMSCPEPLGPVGPVGPVDPVDPVDLPGPLWTPLDPSGPPGPCSNVRLRRKQCVSITHRGVLSVARTAVD